MKVLSPLDQIFKVDLESPFRNLLNNFLRYILKQKTFKKE